MFHDFKIVEHINKERIVRNCVIYINIQNKWIEKGKTNNNSVCK